MHSNGHGVGREEEDLLDILASLHGALTMRSYRRDLVQELCRLMRVRDSETAPPCGWRLKLIRDVALCDTGRKKLNHSTQAVKVPIGSVKAEVLRIRFDWVAKTVFTWTRVMVLR